MSLSKIHIKKWVLSPHAVQRMEERKIAVHDIQELIGHPDAILPQGPKLIFVKNIKKRTDNAIAAVLLERQEKDVWVVVTVMIRFEKRK